MLTIGSGSVRNCQGISRRDVLQIGGLSLLGLSLPSALAAQESSAREDISCIFLWLDGGPSHFETFDPKPEAPDSVRGPYGAIDTNVRGIRICELLPMMAGHMDKCALIRSMTSPSSGHSPLPMLTGISGTTTSYGAVIAKLQGFSGNMPPYVHLGSRLGVGGGTLGPAYNPVEVPDPSGKKINLPQFSLSADISRDRFTEREELLTRLDGLRSRLQKSESVERMSSLYQRAIDMLTSTTVREAFDLSREKERLRNRYGANFFGQSCLLARRLVEAGSRFIQIKWYDGPAWDAWDVHGADLPGVVRMEQHLCPRLDLALSALLEDLSQRGLLKTTLVVVAGEFGRTPRINKYGGRDHWPRCFSALLAGAGCPGGMVIGASDDHGGYPAHSAVTPPEFAATLYRLLGINTNTDVRIRPFIGSAQPVSALF